MTELTDLFKCDCEGKYTIEPHGANNEFHVLYLGRCGHRHGWNLVELYDPALNLCALKHIEYLLNLGLKEHQKNLDAQK
jgi:hypothetical protein